MNEIVYKNYYNVQTQIMENSYLLCTLIFKSDIKFKL